MRWSQMFEVGIPELDAQHRQIFSLILRLNTLVEQRDRSPITQLIFDLETLTKCHFECEAWLIRKFDYPESHHHAFDHFNLLREIHGYRDSELFNRPKLALVLGNWLISHTMQEDRPLAQHLLLKHSVGIKNIARTPVFEEFTITARKLALVDFGNELEDSL
jgi:hemerythrin-like metal-binding protein